MASGWSLSDVRRHHLLERCEKMLADVELSRDGFWSDDRCPHGCGGYILSRGPDAGTIRHGRNCRLAALLSDLRKELEE